MIWYKNHAPQSGVITHLSNAEAWKHSDRVHRSFALELQNVQLGLCADGF